MAPKKKISNDDIAVMFTGHEDYLRYLLYCKEYDLFYIYENGYYKKLSVDDFEVIVFKFIRANFSGNKISITASLVRDVIQLIKWTVHKRVDTVDHRHIAFTDCLYDLEKFETKTFDTNTIVTHRLPFPFTNTKMKTPYFFNFLRTSLVYKDNVKKVDEELIEMVQYMFGFFLIEDIRAGSAFFLVGEGANGKSVMSTVIQDMVGQEYVSAMSIQSLTTDKFSSQHLIGKKVNISNEEESKYIRSDKFKALITGEMVSAERKFGESFEFIPRTKYLFATNQLPTFDGINYGIKRRLIMIPFHRVFKNNERDYNLISKLRKELPGILAWAIEGAKKIYKSNFSFPKSMQVEEAMREFEEEVSSAIRFIREQYDIDDNAFISNQDLYDAYRSWSERVGKKSMNLYNFGRDVMRSDERIKQIRSSNRYGKNLIKKPDAELDVDEILR